MALATPCTGCEGFSNWVRDNQETVEAGGATVGRLISAPLGLPPGLGEAAGMAITGWILAAMGARKKA